MKLYFLGLLASKDAEISHKLPIMSQQSSTQHRLTIQLYTYTTSNILLTTEDHLCFSLQFFSMLGCLFLTNIPIITTKRPHAAYRDTLVDLLIQDLQLSMFCHTWRLPKRIHGYVTEDQRKSWPRKTETKWWSPWICLLDAWKKRKRYSPKWWFNCDLPW